MMYLSDSSRSELRDILKRHEGVSLFAYDDTVGKCTIGYGRCIDREGGKGISLEEAEYLLENDLDTFIKSVEVALPWTASETPKRKIVLVN
ncbi:MAG: lysozyme, partial [Desulfobulbaceae bacterium]